MSKTQLFSNVKSTINKRFFWKTHKFTANVYIRNVGKTGVLFTHDNIGCSLTKFVIGDDNIVNATDNVANSFNLSLSKYNYDKNFFIDKMNKGVPIMIDVETHVVGRPTKGFTIGPRYLTKIH